MTNNSIPSGISKRYILHEHLGTGGMGTVYRVTDRLTGQIVALKRVTAAPEELAFASKRDSNSNLLALAGEFRTLSSLRHPNIISVLDYGFDEVHRPYFTMEYLPNAQPIVEASRGAIRQVQLELIIKILQALVCLHRRGILHRDLKPGNVLVSNKQLKVVDFGLSVETNTDSVKHITQSTAGTFAYMAPELFRGAPVSRASDLYAVGVIAYELFVGHHPFRTNNIALLVNEILNKPVNVYNLGLEVELAMVLRRLLAKTEEARFSDANDVIKALCQATNLPLPPETEAIRESFLQSAKFVGRKAEFGELVDVLDSVLDGHGSSRLVGGESGVGKSRLLDELRTFALVKGAIVLRGQAVSEGGRVFQIWRDMLPLLCLLSSLDDSEASILKPLIPDINDLLGREIADPPPLDPQATQVRLFALITELFRRQHHPMVLILEDLQWAGSGSIGLLNHIIPAVPNMPLLLIGTYRDDESPHLPKHLPGVQVVKLSRLDKASIMELSASILGETAHDPQIVDLLQRETEGIPFFLVEIVRALADHAGELNQIGRGFLPEKLLAGGIRQIIEGRLSRVSEEIRYLLQIAAVIGRELDLNVLQTFSGPEDLESWLTLCASVGILEVQENRWRFTHDKLREYLLEELDAEVRPILHRRAAEAMEDVSSDSIRHAAILAHLWRVAGVEEKELYYCEVAGQQELTNSVYAEGIRFLQRALELVLKKVDTSERAEHELRVQLLLGPALMNHYGHSHPIVADTYSRAAQLGQEIQQSETVFRVVWGLWANAGVGGNLPVAQQMVRRLFDVAQQTGQPFHYMEANHAGWSTAIWQGATRAAEEYYQNGMAHYNKEQYQQDCISLTGHDAGVCGWALGAMNVWLLGYPTRALQRSIEGHSHSLEVPHSFIRSHGLFGSAVVGWLTEDLIQLSQYTEAFLDLSAKNKLTFFMMLSRLCHGWYLTQTGHFQSGIDLLNGAAEVMHQAKIYGPRPLLISCFMDVYLRAGLIMDGLRVFLKEQSEYPLMGERIMESEIHRLRGELLLVQGDVQQAEQTFQQALLIARRQEAKSLELRAAMSLARLCQAQNKRHEGYQILSSVYTWFTEGFATTDLQAAKVLLEMLS
ncbi:MAG: protein kinase [Chloroflexi bacterium]|nr:protein kinase [Chloroflexota bacterium]MBP8057411.1 protein kinase [Chloroflexota bacterium]